MGQNELGMLLVLAVACAIIGISYLHKRRAQPFVDRFAQTYCETVSYVLGDMANTGTPAWPRRKRRVATYVPPRWSSRAGRYACCWKRAWTNIPSSYCA